MQGRGVGEGGDSVGDGGDDGWAAGFAGAEEAHFLLRFSTGSFLDLLFFVLGFGCGEAWFWDWWYVGRCGVIQRGVWRLLLFASGMWMLMLWYGFGCALDRQEMR